jgi:hypothetical protein
VAGAPFTPLAHGLEHFVSELLPTHPVAATGVMVAHLVLSVVIVRFLLSRVLGAHNLRRVPVAARAKAATTPTASPTAGMPTAKATTTSASPPAAPK